MTAPSADRSTGSASRDDTGGGIRRWLVPFAVFAVMAALIVGLEVGTDLSTSEQRWVWSGGFLTLALLISYLRFRKTGRWTPTDAEARESAREMGSNRSLYLTLAFGIVVAIVAVAVTGEWWAALIALVMFAVRGLVDRASWRWFANR